MEGAVKKVALNFLSEKCYKEFFYDLNFFNIICLKALISKVLGYAIIAGSCFVKVPQVLKIWNNRSAKGVSFVNVMTDLYAITTGSSYSFVRSFPFSSYGEGVFLGAQTLAIAAQVLHYNYSSVFAAVFVALYSAICYFMTSGLISVQILWNLQAVSLPILLFGKFISPLQINNDTTLKSCKKILKSIGRTRGMEKLTQAYCNYKIKGTGQLSAATCVMLLFGSVSRVFTSFQETGDLIVIVTYLLATVGNAIIVFQFVYYKKPAGKPQKKREGKKSR